MAGQLVEIRDYTIEPQWWDAYRKWLVEDGAPVLKKKLDIIDFWIAGDIDAEVSGSDPRVSPYGQPQVCWIIRWESKAARDAGFGALLQDEEWQACWARHPNPNAYLQMNGRFMETV